MRNRVYITSIKDKEDIGVSSLTNDAVIDWTVAHQNVLTFVPSLDGLFLNGKKYHSVNKNDNSVKNDDSVRSVMKLVIIRDVDNDDIYNTNYISLVQQKLKKDFDIESLMLSVESDASVNGRIISVVMSVGESVQMFVNKNFGFVFDEKNPDCAVVDRNYIIHAIGVPQNGQPAKILIKHTSDTKDDAALYVIYVYIRYSYNNNITENLIINEIINDKSVSENFVKEGYNKVVESFSEKISSIRTQLTLDKVQFNELIANEQEVSRPSIVQPDFDDSSSNDTP